MVNYDYVAKVLCINKDKKQLSCNGKCHLGKEVAKDFDKDSQDNTPSKIEFSLSLFFNDLDVFHLDFFEYSFDKSLFKSIHSSTHTAYNHKLLQPPQA